MRIGAYEVQGELGRGAMGVVYRVRGPDGREAALKLLLNVDSRSFARFERERRLLASLGEEEGFVSLLDAGTLAEGAWLVMPLVPGGTLRQRLEAGPLGVEETVALGIELANALGRAHERGIVHRDVKPENVLFTSPPPGLGSRPARPLIADLGLAKHFDRSAPGASQSVGLSRTGVVKGTPGYMAPEQLRDAASAGPPADVFALGAVLFECLAGRPAFEGENVLELLAKVSSGTREPLRRPEVPAWLDAIIGRALAQDPLARFADGAALARALGAGKAAPPTSKDSGSRRTFLAPLVLGAVVGGGVLAAALVAMTRAQGKEPAVPPRVPARAPAPSKRASPDAHELVELAQTKAENGDLDGAIADCTKAIELDPTLALAWACRGVARNSEGRLDEGIADCTRAIELDPGITLAWASRGAARGVKADLDGQLADSAKAIELDPGLATAWANRGMARGSKGDWDGQLADCTRAIELDPRLTVAWLCRGVARGRKRDWDGSIADETRAIELDPRLARAWSTRAMARVRKGDWSGVLADATRAIELDPGDASAWLNRGLAHFREGDWDGVIADETKAIELDPGEVAAWENRGAARSNKGDLDGAIADGTRAIELDPGDAGAWLNRSGMRLQKRDWDGAIADSTKAIELAPGDATAWMNRGGARREKGDFPAAITDLERARVLDNGGASAARIREALDEARKRAR